MNLLLKFINEYWVLICSGFAFISALAVFYKNLLSIRKLQLEIDKIKQEKDEAKKLRVIIATQKEIERYGIIRNDTLFYDRPKVTKLGLLFPERLWIIILFTSLALTLVLVVSHSKPISTFVMGIALFVWFYYFLAKMTFNIYFTPRLKALRKIVQQNENTINIERFSSNSMEIRNNLL